MECISGTYTCARESVQDSLHSTCVHCVCHGSTTCTIHCLQNDHSTIHRGDPLCRPRFRVGTVVYRDIFYADSAHEFLRCTSVLVFLVVFEIMLCLSTRVRTDTICPRVQMHYLGISKTTNLHHTLSTPHVYHAHGARMQES
jgi:hypothetical protein